MRFQLEFPCDNAAFEDNLGAEVSTILGVVRVAIDNGFTRGKVSDSNGNTVGTWSLS